MKQWLLFVVLVSSWISSAQAGDRAFKTKVCAMTLCIAGTLNWLACRNGNHSDLDGPKKLAKAHAEDLAAKRVIEEFTAIPAERFQSPEYLNFQRDTLARSVTAEVYFREWADFWKLSAEARKAWFEELDAAFMAGGLKASGVQFPKELTISEQERLTIFTQFAISGTKLSATKRELLSLGPAAAGQLETVEEGRRQHAKMFKLMLGRSPFIRPADELRD